MLNASPSSRAPAAVHKKQQYTEVSIACQSVQHHGVHGMLTASQGLPPVLEPNHSS
jgi:hypothetical protein